MSDTGGHMRKVFGPGEKVMGTGWSRIYGPEFMNVKNGCVWLKIC